jgi:hypothetical protein
MADKHYSRQTPGSRQFMPPGQTIVLVHEVDIFHIDALWGWHRPHPKARVKSMHGLDGWTCTIFRNESPILSSDLIFDAEESLAHETCGPDGLLTYVWDEKIKSTNPGFCFKQAGYVAIGRSKDGKKTLLQKTNGRP